MCSLARSSLAVLFPHLVVATTGAEDQPPFQVPGPGNASSQLARRARQVSWIAVLLSSR